MSSHESESPNSKPEEALEDEWGGDESAPDSQAPLPEKQVDHDPLAHVRIREISGDPADRLLGEEPEVERVPRKEAVFEELGEKRGIEDREWGKGISFRLRWIVPLTVGILTLIIACMVLLQRSKKGEGESRTERLNKQRQESIAKLNARVKDLMSRKQEARRIFGDFATSNVLEDVLPMVHRAAELEPFIREVGHRRMVSGKWMPKENSRWDFGMHGGSQPYAVLSGEMPNFRNFRAYFVMEEEHLMLDWKATTAYGTASFQELSEGKGDGTEIRGFLLPSQLYTKVWKVEDYECYQFESPDGQEIIWCYIRRTAKEAAWLRNLFRKTDDAEKGYQPIPMCLKLAPGIDDGAPNRWLIESVHHREWIHF